MSDDIVKGLRGELLSCQCSAYSRSECCCDAVWPESLCKEAADTIETLHAEVEKLREALDDLLHVSQNMECELQVGEIELSAPFKRAWREAIRAAAAAIREGERDDGYIHRL